jgi:uncharacterized protein YcbX
MPEPELGVSLYMYCSLYQEMGRVESLYLYPVKSLAPVPVPELGVILHAGSWEGLTDRQYMVADTRNKMVTARRYNFQCGSMNKYDR